MKAGSNAAVTAAAALDPADFLAGGGPVTAAAVAAAETVKSPRSVEPRRPRRAVVGVDGSTGDVAWRSSCPGAGNPAARSMGDIHAGCSGRTRRNPRGPARLLPGDDSDDTASMGCAFGRDSRAGKPARMIPREMGASSRSAAEATLIGAREVVVARKRE